jgi:cytolysin (calcineurin-like family phosphatase)
MLCGLYIKSGGLKMKKLWVAVFAWVALAGAAQAVETKTNVNMTFDSENYFSGSVVIAENNNLFSFSSVTGTLFDKSGGWIADFGTVWNLSSDRISSGAFSDGYAMESSTYVIFLDYSYDASGNSWDAVSGQVYNVQSGTYDEMSSGGGTIAAVPEPETYAMLLAGLGLMGAIAKRRKSKQA